MTEVKGYVWGPIHAEDLVQVPGTHWVLTSGKIGAGATQGHLYAVDIRDLSCNEIFPYRASFALDMGRFGNETPLDPLRFEPHGIDIVRRADGIVELYVVNHGWRESIEVFEVALDGPRPLLRWIGAAEVPGSAPGNDVAALADVGFVVSVNVPPEGEGNHHNHDAARSQENGRAFEWTPDSGWSVLPGSEVDVANGIAVSSDGRWVYLGGWRGRTLTKLARGASPPVAPRAIATEILTDNLTWTSDGHLLAAGAFNTTAEEFTARHFGPEPRLLLPSRVIRIDPDSLVFETVVEYGADIFGAACTGLQVGDEIWVGAARDQGLARFSYEID